MKNKFISIIVVLVFVVGVVTGYIFKDVTGEQNDIIEQIKLSLEVIIDEQEYDLNNPINITVKLNNIGTESVRIVGFYYQSNLFIHLRNSTGYLTPKWYEFESIETNQDIIPGENMSSNYNLRDYYDNIPQGDYSLFVTYYSSGYNVYNTTLISNTITFSVV